MKFTLAVYTALCLLIASPAKSAEHYVYASINVCNSWPCMAPEAAPAWHSGAWVDSFLLGIPWSVFMKNDHSVYRNNAQLVAFRKYEGFVNAWQSYLLGGPQIGHCYNAHLSSQAGSSWRDVPSTPYVVCWYGPDPDPCATDPWRIGCDGNPPPDCPLIVNLERGSWSLSGPEDGVLFDIDGDGELESMTWTGPNSELAFVVTDINGNGLVDGGRELFGTAFLLPDGSAAPNGFVALSSYDANHDGIVNAADPRFAELSLWVDRNHNGATDPGELQPIGGSAILGLETAYQRVGRTDVHGNKLRLMAHSITQRGRQPYYDVIFVVIK